MSADNVQSRPRDCPKNYIWPRGEASEANKKFEGNLSRPRLLSADIPASQTGVYSVYSPSINFISRVDRKLCFLYFLYIPSSI